MRSIIKRLIYLTETSYHLNSGVINCELLIFKRAILRLVADLVIRPTRKLPQIGDINARHMLHGCFFRQFLFLFEYGFRRKWRKWRRLRVILSQNFLHAWLLDWRLKLWLYDRYPKLGALPGTTLKARVCFRVECIFEVTERRYHLFIRYYLRL